MKKILIIAGIFATVGFVLALIGLILNGFVFPAAGEYETTTYTVDTAFTDICVDASVADVTFVRSDTDICTVECSERENVRYAVSVNDGTLTIRVDDARKWYEYVEPLWGAMRVTVSLPQSSYETLTHTDHSLTQLLSGTAEPWVEIHYPDQLVKIEFPDIYIIFHTYAVTSLPLFR